MRHGQDTSLGGSREGFPDTSWGVISRLGHSHTEERDRAFETLCRKYWKPVYRYVRIAWAKSNEESKDLTQAFFLWVLETDPLSDCEPGVGSFRRFLKVVLRRFVGHQEVALHRLKRGGGVRLLPLEDAGLDETVPSPAEAERELDRTWMAQLVREAVDGVRERLVTRGKQVLFQVYEEYDLKAGAPKPTYDEVASRLGLKAGDVRNHLFAVRGAVRKEIRTLLAQTTTDAKSFEEEWNELFGT